MKGHTFVFQIDANGDWMMPHPPNSEGAKPNWGELYPMEERR